MICREELAAIILDIMMPEFYALEAGASVYLNRPVGYLDRKDSAGEVLGS